MSTTQHEHLRTRLTAYGLVLPARETENGKLKPRGDFEKVWLREMENA